MLGDTLNKGFKNLSKKIELKQTSSHFYIVNLQKTKKTNKNKQKKTCKVNWILTIATAGLSCSDVKISGWWKLKIDHSKTVDRLLF